MDRSPDSAHADAARALDQSMTAQDVNGDFTACDAALLNRIFTDYMAGHADSRTCGITP